MEQEPGRNEADRNAFFSALAAMSDDVLLRRLADLTSRSRLAEAELVAHLGEVDSRRLYLREACPSLFVYCTERLHYSAAEAYFRIAVARAAQRHPVLLDMLADGRMHLVGIERLAPHLTVANRDAVLERAIHRSKRQIEELVAELAPRPDAPSVIRKLPERRSGEGGNTSTRASRPRQELFSLETVRLEALAPGGEDRLAPAGADRLAPAGADRLAPAGADPFASAGASPLASGAADPVGSAAMSFPADGLRPDGAGSSCGGGRGSIEPTARGRYKVQFTAGVALKEKLERLQRLMRQVVADADLATIVEIAVTEKLERLEARRFAATRKPRRAGVEEPRVGGVRSTMELGAEGETASNAAGRRSRHLTAEIRRTVWARDGEQCRYVSDGGNRCSARERLEFHHRRPYGVGGEHSVGNLSLLCHAHNGYLEEIDYGRRGPETKPGGRQRD